MMASTNSASNATTNQVLSNLSIPLIDLKPLVSASLSDRQKCASEILSAFSTHGFLYLTSPPDVSERDLDNVFSQSASFFARPQAQKDSLAWTTPLANRGYVAPGREKTSHSLDAEQVALERASSGADLKESMEIGRDDLPATPNHWPDSIDAEGIQFRQTMTSFYSKCHALHRLLMSAIALGLGLDESFFDRFVIKGDNNLRLLHYPPVSRDVFRTNKAQVRAGAHTDYGSLTLLWQDGRGGLQVQPDGEGGEWMDVTPVPGTVVVNAGDLLARWSNERIRSTRHRVVEPPKAVGASGESGDGAERTYPARYSVVYFCNPDYDTIIDALPNTYGGDLGDKKFPPVLTENYLVSRLTATY